MKIAKNEMIEAEQFIQGSELPVMELLGLDKEKPKVQNGIVIYENIYARLEVYADNKSVLHVVSGDRPYSSLLNVRDGDYVIRTTDYLGLHSFKLMSKEEIQIKYLTNMDDMSDGYHTFGELYKYRMAYNAAFFNELAIRGDVPLCKSKRHSDGGECFGGGWFIVMAELSTGQISNHYEMKYWDIFNIPEREVGFVYDGHSPKEALDRLEKYLTYR